MCVISLLYSIASYVTSDRLTSKTRRVIFPAHLCLMGWYVCIIVSRILALTLFTHAFGYFVLLFVFAHWLLSVFGILNQKGQFCVDYAQQPRKQRWWLEVPFSLYAACLYNFVYFSLHEGKTRYAVSVYLVVTLIENALMVVLFFTEFHSLWYAPASVAVVVGLFLLGVVLLTVYYLVLHPDRTRDWYWIGVPKKCCDFPACKGKSYRPHHIEISQPTLVNMNGQATNLQPRMSGFQPFTNLITRNKTTGQMQLTAPPAVIESGLPNQDTEHYKKPRSRLTTQSSYTSNAPQQEVQRHTPGSRHVPLDSHTGNRAIPMRHTRSAGSNFSSEQPVASANEMTHVRVLTIPTAPSLGSSVRTESEDLEVPESSVPASESYGPSEQGVRLHAETRFGSTFHAPLANVPNPNQDTHRNTSTSAATGNATQLPHDHDIDSPLLSPYDTLETVRTAAITLKEPDTILKGDDVVINNNNVIENEERERFSASPPNLPTPDFTDHALLPGQPNQQQGVPVSRQQSAPLAWQQSALSSWQPPSSQQQMFQDIPAKRNYLTQPSTLEQHYFPEPSSHSTPNLPADSRGSKIATGVQSNDDSGGSTESRHRSLPPNEDNNCVPQGILEPRIIGPPPPQVIKQTSQGVNPSNYSPRGRGQQRGGRGRGGGGNRNHNKEQKTSQRSYYAYQNPTKPPVRPISVRPHSFHAPQVTAENRQRLFGRTLPGEAVAHGNTMMQSPWQQKQRSTLPAKLIPPAPVQRPNRSPDRSRAPVSFQPNSQTPMRPRSYSEGTTLDSTSSQDHCKSNPNGPPGHKFLGPQYSQHYLGRSPGAPRRGQSYYSPSDRTQILNLTWTPPQFHHDPAISGHSPQQRYKTGPGGQNFNRPPHPPFLKEKSKTAHELTTRGVVNFNPPGNFSNPLPPGNNLHGARRLSTNQNAGKANPLLHVPASNSHTSRV